MYSVVGLRDVVDVFGIVDVVITAVTDMVVCGAVVVVVVVVRVGAGVVAVADVVGNVYDAVDGNDADSVVDGDGAVDDAADDVVVVALMFVGGLDNRVVE